MNVSINNKKNWHLTSHMTTGGLKTEKLFPSVYIYIYVGFF